MVYVKVKAYPVFHVSSLMLYSFIYEQFLLERRMLKNSIMCQFEKLWDIFGEVRRILFG